MKRVILDTNIYGFILENNEPEEFKQLISTFNISIYGINIIRKELRNAPKNSTVFNRSIKTIGNLRNSLLALYDSIIKKEYTVSEKIILIATNYYTVYSELGGKENWQEMENDFVIVACGSIHNLDIIVSGDNKTMLSDDAIKAYAIVNKLNSIKTPEFIGYEKFRRLLT